MTPIAKGMRGTLRAAAFLLVALIAPLSAWAANCPFCYSKAMSSSGGILQAFRHGIIILMIPPFLMSVVISVVAYRRRNAYRSR
jgi:hypothetical protein